MKYRKKPVLVDALEWKGNNREAVLDFVGRDNLKMSFFPKGRLDIRIVTLEGILKVRHGDWIIKGIKGEFYPCKPDIFAETYEPVEAPEGQEPSGKE